MKLTFTILSLLFLFSCENPAEKSNERLKTSIFKKGTEIQENYKQYKNDITNSGFATLLSLDRLKQDRNLEESKKIIQKAESILTNFNQKNQILVSDLKNLFDSIQPTEKINPNEIERMKSKFDESIEITKSNYKSDSTVLALNKQIIQLLDEECEYEINGEQIQFYNENCVFQFNYLNSQIETAVFFAKFDVSKRKFEKIKSNNR